MSLSRYKPLKKVIFPILSEYNNPLDRSTQRSSASNDAVGYQVRKIKKKTLYREDFAPINDSKKSRDKVKTTSQQLKKTKVTSKPTAPVSASHVKLISEIMS